MQRLSLGRGFLLSLLGPLFTFLLEFLQRLVNVRNPEDALNSLHGLLERDDSALVRQLDQVNDFL